MKVKEEFENVNDSSQDIKPISCWSVQIKI